jgi:hypothetical protein
VFALAHTGVCDGKVGDRAVLDGFAPRTIEPACQERFLKEAPPAWQALQDRLVGFEVAVEHQSLSETRPADKEELTFCVLSQKSRKLVLTGKDASEIGAANERYTFAVNRLAGTSYLDECEVWRENSVQPLAMPVRMCNGFLESMWSIWWVPLDAIVENSAFKLVGAQFAAGENGQEIVKVAYRYEGPRIVKPPCQPNAVYWAELSPAQSWVVLRSGVTNMSDEGGIALRIRVTSRYQDWFGGGPFPAESVLEYEESKRNIITDVQETRFGEPRKCERPEAEVFLPFYGISESVVPGLSGGSHWRLGAIVASFICAILGWMLYKRSSSRLAGQGP